MSKILVIEPNRMLQYAIASCLLNEHEPYVTDACPQPVERVGDFGAVIVDGAALRETTDTDRDPVQTVASWRMPTVWIDAPNASNVPAREGLVRLEIPIIREKLQAALSRALELGETRGAPGSAEQTTAGPKADGAAADRDRVIELVDVIEEGSGLQKEQTEAERAK